MGKRSTCYRGSKKALKFLIPYEQPVSNEDSEEHGSYYLGFKGLLISRITRAQVDKRMKNKWGVGFTRLEGRIKWKKQKWKLGVYRCSVKVRAYPNRKPHIGRRRARCRLQDFLCRDKAGAVVAAGGTACRLLFRVQEACW